ncbi:MAG: chorismate pyruvate-lyase family protein [Xenococcaceae cyanobacterium MO_207.B15]|nr:chorismate pyruvate-lyase family protein [Xenococcaceae cyanobacterium MO_207.B15]
MSINYTEAFIPHKKDQTIRGNLQPSTHSKTRNNLNGFQRMLIKANGTVTAMLEAYLSEPIQVVKLSENIATMKLEFPNIKLNSEEQVIARKVLLQGKMSGGNFIYADSLILINNLDERFRNQLLNTNIPIGKLWTEHKVETFKEIIESGIEPANELSNYFCIDPKENLLFRTYSVSSQGKINMIITEKFPESYFSPQVTLAS